MMNKIEYWLFSEGMIIRTERTDSGFHNIDTGRLYSHHEFLQYVQGNQGHPITEKAYVRFNEGNRSFYSMDD